MRALALSRCTRVVAAKGSAYDYAIEASDMGCPVAWEPADMADPEETGLDKPTPALLVWGESVAVVFVLDEVIFQGVGSDREVTGWRFVAAPRHRRLVPASAGVTVTVLND